jgi:hypothetical protein
MEEKSGVESLKMTEESNEPCKCFPWQAERTAKSVKGPFLLGPILTKGPIFFL